MEETLKAHIAKNTIITKAQSLGLTITEVVPNIHIERRRYYLTHQGMHVSAFYKISELNWFLNEFGKLIAQSDIKEGDRVSFCGDLGTVTLITPWNFSNNFVIKYAVKWDKDNSSGWFSRGKIQLVSSKKLPDSTVTIDTSLNSEELIDEQVLVACPEPEFEINTVRQQVLGYFFSAEQKCVPHDALDNWLHDNKLSFSLSSVQDWLKILWIIENPSNCWRINYLRLSNGLYSDGESLCERDVANAKNDEQAMYYLALKELHGLQFEIESEIVEASDKNLEQYFKSFGFVKIKKPKQNKWIIATGKNNSEWYWDVESIPPKRELNNRSTLFETKAEAIEAAEKISEKTTICWVGERLVLPRQIKEMIVAKTGRNINEIEDFNSNWYTFEGCVYLDDNFYPELIICDEEIAAKVDEMNLRIHGEKFTINPEEDLSCSY